MITCALYKSNSFALYHGTITLNTRIYLYISESFQVIIDICVPKPSLNLKITRRKFFHFPTPKSGFLIKAQAISFFTSSIKHKQFISSADIPPSLLLFKLQRTTSRVYVANSYVSVIGFTSFIYRK